MLLPWFSIESRKRLITILFQPEKKTLEGPYTLIPKWWKDMVKISQRIPEYVYNFSYFNFV